MKISVSSIELQGVLLGEENPLPYFRKKERKLSLENVGLLQEEMEGFDYETGFRVLPYRMQDNYTRKKQKIRLKTIVLENEKLRATFLPEYGARLYSLYNKVEGRELLYVNPVFQPANLAIRNAWFSGGIEWNIGQIGHTFLTMEDYFAVICKNEDGEEFLRFYEYERCKCVFIQMDFHLPSDSNQLIAHVRIQNTRDEAVPMYWWTNIAVQEERNVRVLSGTNKVICITYETCEDKDSTHYFLHDSMPYLKALKGLDASYPGKFSFSSEYFFQNSKRVECTWEAAYYDDGSIFYERSTKELAYRKLFCWGNHKGGKRWKEFLSSVGTGEYIEIQAGFARTQVHGFDLGAKETLSFTQVFGSVSSSEMLEEEVWADACHRTYKIINEQISEKQLDEIDNRCSRAALISSEMFLHMGSGWGALEHARDQDNIPQQLYFPAVTLSDEQIPWLELLQKRFTPEVDDILGPRSYMIDNKWLNLVNISQCSENADNFSALILLGISWWENGEHDKALCAFGKALEFKRTPYALRCLAMLLLANGQIKEAFHNIEEAIECLGDSLLNRAYCEDYLLISVENCEYQKAWNFYKRLKDELKKEERISILVAPAALETGQDEFLQELFLNEFAVTREGEVGLVEIYRKFMASKLIERSGNTVTSKTLEEVKNSIEIPYHMDFRMIAQ